MSNINLKSISQNQALQLVENNKKFNELLQNAFQSQLQKTSTSADQISLAERYLKQLFPNIKYSKLIQLMYKAILYKKQIHFRQEEVRVHKQLSSRQIQSDVILYANLKQKHKFKSFQDLLKFSQRILTAKVLCVKGYGTSTVRQYCDSFRCPIQIQKNNYNTFSTGAVTAICRKIQWFIVTKCKRKIQPFNQAQIRALHTPLQNYRLRLDQAQGYTFQKFIKATFNLSTVIISINEALRLYVSILRACRDQNITQQNLIPLSFSGDEKIFSTKQDNSQGDIKIQNLLKRKRKSPKPNINYKKINGKQINLYEQINQIMPEEQFQLQEDYFNNDQNKIDNLYFQDEENDNLFKSQFQEQKKIEKNVIIQSVKEPKKNKQTKMFKQNQESNQLKNKKHKKANQQQEGKKQKLSKKQKKAKKKQKRQNQKLDKQKNNDRQDIEQNQQKKDQKYKNKESQILKKVDQSIKKQKSQEISYIQKKQKNDDSQISSSKNDELQISASKNQKSFQKEKLQQHKNGQIDNNQIDFDFDDFKVEV